MQLRVDCKLPEVESCNRCTGKNGDDAKRLDPWRTQTSAQVALWQSRWVAGMSEFVQVSRTPASQKHPRAPTTGVREAPRHEIAGRKGLCFAAAIYGDLRSASVCFREAGTTDARQFDGLTGRGERAPSALGSGLVWRRRSQDVGAASSSERRRRWLTVSGKNGKNGRRCVAVDNAISIMTYRS